MVSRKIELGFGGTGRNLDICLSVDSLGSISHAANHTHGCKKVSGIPLAIFTADPSSVSFEVLFMMTTIFVEENLLFLLKELLLLFRRLALWLLESLVLEELLLSPG